MIRRCFMAGVAALSLLSVAALAEPVHNTLMKAIHAGDPAKVQRALDMGASLNQPLVDGSLPLAWAVETQNVLLVNYLLEQGARPDSGDSHLNSFSPLVVACQRGDPDIVMALLQAGAIVNHNTASGISPLALCAANTSLQVVEQLLARDANVEAADDNGQTPLMWAAARGRVDIIPLLLAKGAALNRTTLKGFTPLFFAMTSGNAEATKLLIEAGADITHRGPRNTSAIQMAIYQKQFEIAGLLLERGADLSATDRNGHQLLHAAIINNQPALVKRLLQQGASPDALTGVSQVVWRYEVNFTSRPYLSCPKSPLLLAAEAGSPAIMKMLVDAGANIHFTADDGTNLVFAALLSDSATLAFALELLPKANLANKNHQTPLHMLMRYSGYMPMSSEHITTMFTVLSRKGARADIPDGKGQTAADIAAEEDFKFAAEFAAVFQPEKR